MPHVSPRTTAPLVALRVAAQPENLALVRHVLAGFGDVGAVPSERLDDVLLAVSEAVTDVVRREEPQTSLTVTGDMRDNALVVEVVDPGHGVRPRLDPRGPGRSMSFITALADQVTFSHDQAYGAEIELVFRV